MLKKHYSVWAAPLAALLFLTPAAIAQEAQPRTPEIDLSIGVQPRETDPLLGLEMETLRRQFLAMEAEIERLEARIEALEGEAARESESSN